MKRYVKKIIIIMTVVVLVSPTLARAEFRDDEISTGNTFSASSLDAEVSAVSADWQDSDVAKDLLPGESVKRDFKIKNVGGLDFQYKLKFEKTAGSDDLCSALHLVAEKNGTQVWEGNLSDFDYAVANLDSSSTDNWHFKLTLPNNVENLNSLNCDFKFAWTAWQKDFSAPDKGWVDTEESENSIHSGITAPTQTGYNVKNGAGDDFATPRNPNELPCQGAYTNINGISVHWTDVAHNNPRIKYQRQYKKFGNGGYDWCGSEIYTNPYTNFRTFGGNNGQEGRYGSRVRAWDDVNGNNKIDSGETVSKWSNECSVTYDITPPAKPTGLRRIAPDENGKIYNCGDLSKIQKMWPDWNDNTEPDFDHYEYTSFNAPNGAIGLNEKVFKESIFKYTGSWLPKNGTYGFAVRAVDKAGNKSAWALGGSKTLADSCQITYDSEAPKVKIINLNDGDFVSGKVDIKGTVTDAHPDYYWLVVQNKNGHTIAGPGTVNDNQSFSDKKLYSWDTTAVPDGEYVIKLEARDVLGNKDPNQAPISTDPERTDDSVDWVDVTVDNTAPNISDKYFEISTKGEENPDEDNPFFDAVITWTTDEPTIDVVEWGKTKFYNHKAGAIDSAYKTEHKVIVKNLPINSSIYHFRIKSIDRAGNTTYSDDEIMRIKGIVSQSTNNDSSVVINEFLPNPVGDDDARRPKGEWVELYNRINHEVDLRNWLLVDNGWSSSHHNPMYHRLPLPAKIGPYQHLVIYKNGSYRGRHAFSLGNSGDRIRLLEKVEKKYCWTLWGHRKCRTKVKYIVRDSYSYTASQVAEGKSIARFPDGGAVWVDPEATPGKDNKMTEEELKHFREYTLKKCFKKNKLKKNPQDKMCEANFLAYLGMIKSVSDNKLIYHPEKTKSKSKKDKKQKNKTKNDAKNKKSSAKHNKAIIPKNENELGGDKEKQKDDNDDKNKDEKMAVEQSDKSDLAGTYDKLKVKEKESKPLSKNNTVASDEKTDDVSVDDAVKN